mgnify:CR=1 FL=1
MNYRTRVAIDISVVHVPIDYSDTFLQQNKDKYLFVFTEFSSSSFYVYMYMLCQSIERIGENVTTPQSIITASKDYRLVPQHEMTRLHTLKFQDFNYFISRN